MCPTLDNRLPYELWGEIVSMVPHKQDLLNLCLTNSTLRRIATEYLYHSIRVKRLSNVVCLYRTVSKRVDLARHIVELDLSLLGCIFPPSRRPRHTRLNGMPLPPRFPFYSARAFLSVICGLFRLLSNMTVFKLRLNKMCQRIEPHLSKNLRQLPPHLTVVEFESITVLGLLQSQNKLRSVTLQWIDFEPGIDHIGENSLPDLRRIISDDVITARLAKGRPLEAYHLHNKGTSAPSKDDLRRCLSLLRVASRTLEFVELDMVRPEMSLFTEISSALPDLQGLSLHIQDCQAGLPLLLSPDNDEIIEGLRGFRRLGRLEMHLGRTEHNVKLPMAIALAQFNIACITLHTFVLTSEVLSGGRKAHLYPTPTVPVHWFRKAQPDLEWKHESRTYAALPEYKIDTVVGVRGLCSAGEEVGDHEEGYIYFDAFHSDL